MAVTNAVSWRSDGIFYRKNEVFLDVIESVNLLVNANGNVARSEILGQVKMKVYLSGMPELRLGLNDKVMFENTGRCNFAFATLKPFHIDSSCGTRKNSGNGGHSISSMCPFIAF